MQAIRDAVVEDIEILPVIVVSRTFPARPSAVPDVRDFVRKQLAQTTLAGDNVRALDHRVADVLLEAAGMGGAIQVSLRIFDSHAEVDVLQAAQGEVAGTTGAFGAVPPPDARASGASASQSERPSAEPAAAGPTAAQAAVARPPAGQATRGDVPFAEWLADAIRREGMTMEAAARRLKVSVKTVSRWVRGATEPRLGDLARIQQIFGDLPLS